jgi:hypothetical protein
VPDTAQRDRPSALRAEEYGWAGSYVAGLMDRDGATPRDVS